MPQQINLSTPVLLSQKRYFSAQTMAIAFGIFAAFGGTLCAAWVWSLGNSSAGFTALMATQTQEIAGLQAAILRTKASAAPPDASLLQELEDRRKAVLQKTQLLSALQDGMFAPGQGHSDRLQWIARSIPAPVWVTEIQADAARLEARGFTLEPAALNAWVDKLGQGALMRDLKLDTVQVKKAVGGTAVWGFHLVSQTPKPVAVVAPPVGGQP